MNLLLLSTAKQIDGLIEVQILIQNKKNKEYTYYLNSEYALRQFQRHYKFGNYGKALEVLRKFNVEGR